MKKSYFALLSTLFSLSATLALAPRASADILLTNYPASSSSGLFSVSPSLTTPGLPVEVGLGFKVGSLSYSLNSMTVRMSGDSSYSALEMRLYSDNAGLPGTDLGATFNTVALSGYNNPQDNVFSPLSTVILNANTSYWLNVHLAPGQGMTGLFGNSLLFYRTGSNPPPGLVASGAGATSLGVALGDTVGNNLVWRLHAPAAPAIHQIDGTVVPASSAPEPTSLLFFPLGGTLILLRKGRK